MSLADTLKFGLGIPQDFRDDAVDMELARKVAERAGALGFEDLWTNEGILTPARRLDPIVLLSYIAAATSTVKLGVSVLVLPLHSPVHVAKRIGSLDQVSNGRAILGVGLGELSDRYRAFDTTPERRVRRFEQSVELIKALWTEPATNYSGDFFYLQDAQMEPKPIQRPHPSIWFGGTHPNTLRRAASMADGWMGAGGSSADVFNRNVVEIRRVLEENGRDLDSFPISRRVFISVDTDETRSDEYFRRRFGEAASTIAVWGSPERCTEVLEEIASVGVSRLLLEPVSKYEEQCRASAIMGHI